MQKKGLGLTVSTQQSIIKTDLHSPRYDPKRDGLDWPNQTVMFLFISLAAVVRLDFLSLR